MGSMWGESILVNGHHSQWRTIAFDGDEVYSRTGPLKSARARLVGTHCLGDMTHNITWDLAHSCNLLIEDGHKTYPYNCFY